MKYTRHATFLLIFSACAVLSSAQAKNAIVPFENWNVSGNSNGMYAFTINDSGELLGEYCYYKTGNCSWLLGIHTSCKSNITGFALANASGGSLPLNILCTGNVPHSSLYEYVFTNWKKLESEFQDASQIGFAVALQADRFIVIRFSLVGRTDAEAAMQAVFEHGLKEFKAHKKTVDQTM